MPIADDHAVIDMQVEGHLIPSHGVRSATQHLLVQHHHGPRGFKSVVKDQAEMRCVCRKERIHLVGPVPRFFILMMVAMIHLAIMRHIFGVYVCSILVLN